MAERIEELMTVERRATVDVVRFQVAAVVDSLDVELVENRITEVLQAGEAPRLLLDLERVDQVSSEMLSTLVEVRSLVKERDGRLALANLQPRIKDLFEITRIDTIFDAYLSEEAALAALLD